MTHVIDGKKIKEIIDKMVLKRVKRKRKMSMINGIKIILRRKQ